MKKALFVLLLISIAFEINAQENSDYVKKGFIIIAAGKNYDAMKKMAKTASQKLNYKLDLRGLEFNKEIGLSFSEQECKENGFEFPAYINRGRWDDGEYVSIEYTNDYAGFTPELYIIIVSSHDKGNKALSDALTHVKKVYKNAYIKYTDIYMGCMH